ncbi:MAG: hypothetical protein R8K22_01755 [Mariprofundaceae bacterium]
MSENNEKEAKKKELMKNLAGFALFVIVFSWGAYYFYDHIPK